MNQYLQESYFLDFSHPTIQSLVEEFRNLGTQEKIAQLYLKVRDGWRYNPYKINLKPESYKASVIAAQSEGHCIDKSILYIASLRALEVPARLRLAKVANHIAVEKLVERLGSNELAPHGISEVFFNDKWVKSSTAFNKELCEKFNVDVLDFDGTEDSVFQEYNKQNHKFMEYLEDYGSFEDVPLQFIIDTFRAIYPEIYEANLGNDELQL